MFEELTPIDIVTFAAAAGILAALLWKFWGLRRHQVTAKRPLPLEPMEPVQVAAQPTPAPLLPIEVRADIVEPPTPEVSELDVSEAVNFLDQALKPDTKPTIRPPVKLGRPRRTLKPGIPKLPIPKKRHRRTQKELLDAKFGNKEVEVSVSDQQ